MTKLSVAQAQEPIGKIAETSRAFAWLVFALTIGLLLSDYMSRQVINVVFPLLKAEWSLSDKQLGLLGGIVPLMVGILTVPLSFLADRLGRVRSIVLMAALWSLATLASGMAQGYGEMLMARTVIGLGEAAYGSVGLAVIFSVFPVHWRSTLSGIYGGAALLGAVIGLAIGGKLAAALGWRGAFDLIAVFGFILVGLYMTFVREAKLGQTTTSRRAELGGLNRRDLVAALFKTPSVLYTYLGSGAQLFITGALIVWTPTYFGRYYHLPTEKAAIMAAGFILMSGLGMGICGNIADRLARNHPSRKLLACIVYSILSFFLLALAFRLPPGPAQLVLLGFGIFVSSGTWGPTTAVVANLTPMAMHSTSMAVLTLINNLLGLFPGPFVTGLLSDKLGLDVAFQWMPLACIVSTVALTMAWRHYDADLLRKRTQAAR
ncbi:Major facilitator superfamily MFS 1 [Georgfuchsia toluolica]|uniref:Major facilitator superfamily MFS 1 n=1 Tax=Georgfuchsia toluolica TaxID=424218 RepID=A0A916N089_9PROT|nr:MFS transporter [Georgfuchsia toluolica]CAG4883673.1 Major facilitator superfamily MFS 1 [Georgfuchsia toluolica]